MSTAGTLLETDRIDRYRALGAFGKPVYLDWVNLRAALDRTLGKTHSAYFARPERDPDAKDIRWTTDLDGPVTRWVDLTPEQKIDRALTLAAMQSAVHAHLASLEAQSAGPAVAFASVLRQAFTTPDDSHLFFVGDQPVVTFWGFTGPNGEGLDALGLRGPVPTAAPAAPVPVPAPASRPPWWPWLLWALLFLLLLALLLFGARYCMTPPTVVPPLPGVTNPRDPTPVTPVPAERITPVAPERIVPERGVPEGTAPGAVVPGVVVPGAPAPPGTVPPPTVPPGTVPPPVPPPIVPPPPPAPPTPPRVDPPRAEPPRVDPPRPPAPGRGLVIPPTAPRDGQAGFLEGLWQSLGGLVDAETQAPLAQTYRFRNDGSGKVVIKRADGSECRGAARSRMEGGRLIIEETEDARCPDGQTFARSRTECMADAAGRTRCTGRNPDGTPYRVEMERAP